MLNNEIFRRIWSTFLFVCLLVIVFAFCCFARGIYNLLEFTSKIIAITQEAKGEKEHLECISLLK